MRHAESRSQIEELRRCPPGMTLDDISRKFGGSKDRAHHMALRAGYQTTRKVRNNETRKSAARERCRDIDWTQTLEQIGAQLGVTRQRAEQIAKYLGVNRREARGKRRSEKLATATKLIAAVPAGLTISEICRRTGLSRQHVGRAIAASQGRLYRLALNLQTHGEELRRGEKRRQAVKRGEL